ncbi:MAG: two-component system, cell cycle response regulator [Frankiaceae bacterium]|jgi:diguanylate cyclase (GGDEF)-like protein|nr:two-component system, cell cycle response regulator [Frankiaceae bacterium]
MEPGHDKLQVLLVEDRKDAARAVAVACRDLTIPVELTAVYDVEAARARLETGDYDVVLLEAAIAAMPGIRALTELRGTGRSVPFVALTPTYDPDLAQDFLDAGADDWLSLADELTSRMLARVIGHAIERHHLWKAVQENTHIDALTGVLNERGFRHAVRQQLALASRDVRPLAVLVLDVDRMQEINNEYGWDEGDRVLETVADVVRRTFRVSDIVGRTGDDEFAILLCGNGFRDVDAGVSRVMANLDLYAEALVLPYSLTMSVGWTVTQPERALGVDEVLDEARSDLQANSSSLHAQLRPAEEQRSPETAE